MRRWTTAVIAASMLALAGCAQNGAPGGATVDGAETYSIRGVIAVPAHDEEGTIASTVCNADGGYSDFRDGAQITALDPSGEIVAVGSLSRGTRDGDGASYKCKFPFTIEGVPPGEKFYSLDVGNEFRGIYTIPEDKVNVYVTLTVD